MSKTGLTPRIYQTKTHDNFRDIFIPSTNQMALIQHPPGGGKTFLFSMITELTEDRYCLIVPRINLAKQTLKSYPTWGLCQGKTLIKPNARVVIFTLQTYLNLIEKNRIGYDDFKYVFVDECHMMTTDKSQGKIIENVKRMGQNIIGLSATPFDSDGVQLESYKEAIELVPKEWRYSPKFVDKGYLVPIVCKTVGHAKESELVVGSTGEYTENSVKKAMDESPIDVVETTARYAKGQTLMICLDTNHANALTEDFNNNRKFADGRPIKAVAIHTKTKDEYTGKKFYDSDGNRITIDEAKIRDFANKKFNVLVSVGKIGTGTDIPIIETVGLARIRRAKNLIEQEWGRGSRLCPEIGKKYCLFLDFYGSLELSGRHPDIPWTPLEEKPSKKKETVACKECRTSTPLLITGIKINIEEYEQTTFKKCGKCGNETATIKEVAAVTCKKCNLTQIMKNIYSFNSMAVMSCKECGERIELNKLTPKELIVTVQNRDSAVGMVDMYAKERLDIEMYERFTQVFESFKIYADLTYLSALIDYFGNINNTYSDKSMGIVISRMLEKTKYFSFRNSSTVLHQAMQNSINYVFIEIVKEEVKNREVLNYDKTIKAVATRLRAWLKKEDVHDTKKLTSLLRKFLTFLEKEHSN